MDWMPQVIREGIFTILFISGPLVILAAALGLIVGILQAATQVQEQTLGSAVKIIGLFIALIIFGFYIFQYMQRYTAHSLEKAFKLVPTLGTYIKPRRNFLEVPKEVEQASNNLPTALPEPTPQRSSGVASPKLGIEQQAPTRVEVNKNPSVDRLAPPRSQSKKPDTNVKSQELPKIVRSTPAKQSISTAAKPTQRTAPLNNSPQQATTQPRPVVLAPANSAQGEVLKPVVSPLQERIRQLKESAGSN